MGCVGGVSRDRKAFGIGGGMDQAKPPNRRARQHKTAAVTALLAATGLAYAAWWLFGSDVRQGQDALDRITGRAAATSPPPPAPPPLAYKPLSVEVEIGRAHV